MSFNLNTVNPSFPLHTYELHNLLTEGIRTDSDKKRFLIKHNAENDTAFNVRVKRSVYRNFASPIVTAFTSSVFSEKPNRTLPERLKQYEDDVDKNLNDAHTFFYEVALNTAIKGLHYVFVGLPEGEYFNLEQAKLNNHRPYFVSIDARDVIDANDDYVVIRNVYNKSLGVFQGYETISEYTVWFKDHWEKWLDGKTPIKIAEGVNKLGFIPIVPFYFRKIDDYVGSGSLTNVDELIISLFRKDSELDKALFDAAIPLLILSGFDSESISNFKRSTDSALATTGEADGKFIEPTGVSFEALQSSIDKLENSIREIALKNFKKETTAVESAESKKIDQTQFENQVIAFAKNLEDSEEICWYYFDLLNGGSGKDIEIKYTKRFDIDEISDSLLSELKDMATKNLISKETLWRVMQENKLLPEDFDEEDELAKLNKQSFSLPSF